MKDITTYEKKNIEPTTESIKSTETTLRNLTENQESQSIGIILKANVEATKSQLQQQKLK